MLGHRGLLVMSFYFLKKCVPIHKGIFSGGEALPGSVSPLKKRAADSKVPLTQLNQKEPDISSLGEYCSVRLSRKKKVLSHQTLQYVRSWIDGLTTLGFLFIDGRLFLPIPWRIPHRDKKISRNDPEFPKAGTHLSVLTRNLTDINQKIRHVSLFEYHI